MSYPLMTAKLDPLVREFARRLAPLYVLLQWKWHDTGVPDCHDIEAELRRQIDLADPPEAIPDATSWTLSSGGLFVGWEKMGDEGGIRCFMSFEVESSAHVYPQEGE